MTDKAKKRIPPVSKKRLAAHPDLRWRNSTVTQQPTAKRKRSTMDLKRRTKVKRENRKRRKANAARANGTLAYKTWLHVQPCAPCGWSGTTEEAHAGNGGMSRKADASETFPACGPHLEYTRIHGKDEWVQVEGCHRELHRIGVKAWSKKHRKSPQQFAAETQVKYAAYVAGQTPFKGAQ